MNKKRILQAATAADVACEFISPLFCVSKEISFQLARITQNKLHSFFLFISNYLIFLILQDETVLFSYKIS